MKLIFLHGLPGVGKYTIGTSLQELTDYKLFHNHLIVDTLMSVFPFGSEEFIRLREKFWLEVFKEATLSRISCIFTFAPEKTVQPTFIQKTTLTVQENGGIVSFVELTCASEEMEKRIIEPSRKRYGKLQSIERLRELEKQGAFEFPEIESDLAVDTTSISPEVSAQKIANKLGLL